MVGSHKGSCHIFDTSGMTAFLSHILTHAQLFYFVFVICRQVITLRAPVPHMMNSCVDLIIAEKKLQYKTQIDLRIRKKKSGQKKITGFQVI